MLSTELSSNGVKLSAELASYAGKAENTLREIALIIERCEKEVEENTPQSEGDELKAVEQNKAIYRGMSYEKAMTQIYNLIRSFDDNTRGS